MSLQRWKKTDVVTNISTRCRLPPAWQSYTEHFPQRNSKIRDAQVEMASAKNNWSTWLHHTETIFRQDRESKATCTYGIKGGELREVGCTWKTYRRAQNKTGFSSSPERVRDLWSWAVCHGWWVRWRKPGGGKAVWMSWNWWVVMCKGFVHVQAAFGECGGFF